MDETNRASTDKISRLTNREGEILALLMQGRRARVIAKDLHLKHGTVNWHLANIYQKLGVNDKVSAIIEAQRLGVGQ